jgi:hypothetical protein
MEMRGIQAHIHRERGGVKEIQRELERAGERERDRVVEMRDRQTLPEPHTHRKEDKEIQRQRVRKKET